MYRSFPLRLASTVRCPADRGELRASVEGEWIGTGFLECTTCGRRLPVEDGILNMLEGQLPVDGAAAREIAARDREALTFDRRSSNIRNDMEVPSTLGGVDFSGRDVVDLGCGTGRITSRVIDTAGSVLAIDFSRRSLEVFAEKLQDNAEVGLVLGDVTTIPLTRGAFDVALSTQVIEHIPTREARSAFFEFVRKAIRVDGVFVCTVYHHDLRSRLGRIQREGTHESGIFYHRFTRREIKAEMKRHFDDVSVRPIKIAIPYLIRLPLPWGRVSRALERVPLLNSLGHLLRVVARNRGHRKPGSESRGDRGLHPRVIHHEEDN
jgi:SAM-dependent methyltransferase